MEIYAPLAERLGIWQIKWELEDLAFKVLEPEAYRELAKLLDTRRKGREDYIERAIGELRPRLEAAGIEADLQGRPKHIYSIHKKMQRKSRRVRRDLRRLRDPRPRRRGPRLLRRARHRPRPLAADPRPVRRLHREPEEQPLPVAPHRGDRARREAARDPDPDPRDAPGERGRHRRPLALQGRLEVRPRVRREARLAPPADGVAARRLGLGRDRVRRGDQARHLPGPGLRLHAEGRHQGPAGRRDAARLRLPDPHRRRPPDDRGEGQQPARPARLPAEERRHRRDRHDEGRARPVARLAEHRPDLPRPGEDPAMVQEEGPRREHRPRPRVARAGAAAARPEDDPGGRHRQDRGGRPVVQLRLARGLLRGDRLRRGQPPAGRGQARGPRRHRGRPADGRAADHRRRGPAGSGSRASATCSSGSRSAATRSRAIRSSGSSPAARA